MEASVVDLPNLVVYVAQDCTSECYLYSVCNTYFIFYEEEIVDKLFKKVDSFFKKKMWVFVVCF